MSLRIAPLLLIVALGTPADAAEGVWRWVDAQGITHYSDRPVPGAVQIDIKVQATSESQVEPTTASPATATSPQAAQPPYTLIEIWKPAPEESVVNTGGVVSVRVRLEPALRPRHTLAIYLDGKRLDNLPPGALDVEVPNVPRGTHSLVASVFDDAGKVVQQGQQVVFFVRQESTAQPPVGPTLRPRPRPAN
jgi:Domain of unknown function (DUF4124)